MVAAAEMALAGRLGLSVDLSKVPADSGEDLSPTEKLMTESNGRYLVEVPAECVAEFEVIMTGLPFAQIGVVVDEPLVSFAEAAGAPDVLALTLSEIETAWRGHIHA